MNAIEQVKENTTTNRTFANACLASCQNLIAQIEKTKDAILIEFRETLDANEHLLRLALNEAEALAWQTEFPQLIFPTLATEKAQAVAAWSARQQSILRTNSRFALAA
jgi:hypothetical protein